MNNLLITRPFVFVLWEDAVTKHGWGDADAEGVQGVEFVWSAGWMAHRDKREVKLVADVGAEDNSFNRSMAIPMTMIEEIRAGAMDGPILYQRRKRGKKAQSEVQSNQ